LTWRTSKWRIPKLSVALGVLHQAFLVFKAVDAAHYIITRNVVVNGLPRGELVLPPGAWALSLCTHRRCQPMVFDYWLHFGSAVCFCCVVPVLWVVLIQKYVGSGGAKAAARAR